MSVLNFPKTKRMSCGKVNGLEEADFYKKGESGGCCRASCEVTQVSILHTQQHNDDLIGSSHCNSLWQEDLFCSYKRQSLVKKWGSRCSRNKWDIFFRNNHLPVSLLIFDPCAWVTACIIAVSRSMSSGRRMRGSGQQSIVQHCGKQDATITETITLNLCLEIVEEEEADS